MGPLVGRRALAPALGVTVLGLFLNVNASASTVVVTPAGTTACKSGLASYPTISQAVSSVPAGSSIYICPGTYAEQVVITKKLTLVGLAGNGTSGAAALGSNNPVVVSPAGGVAINTVDLYENPNGQPTAAQILVQTPSNSLSTPILVNISNITVDGSNNGLSGCATDLVGIYYQNASGTLDHVSTRYQELDPSDFGCQDGLAIYVQSGYGTGGTALVTIEDSMVHDYDKNGITVDGSGTVATVTGNYVVGIGATPLIAQNGIQMSFGAGGKITNNTVTDDVYVNPADCYNTVPNSCYSSTGILLYDSGGTYASQLTISGNTVSNTQGGIVTYTDGDLTADYNTVSSNKVTTTPAIVVTGYTYYLDGIDLCSSHNTASNNTVFYSSGSGVHLDSSCTEPGGGPSGVSSSASGSSINEACAGVLTGNSGATATTTTTYNVIETTYAGDTCPVGNGSPSVVSTGASLREMGKVKPRPRHH